MYIKNTVPLRRIVECRRVGGRGDLRRHRAPGAGRGLGQVGGDGEGGPAASGDGARPDGVVERGSSSSKGRKGNQLGRCWFERETDPAAATEVGGRR